MSNFAWPKAKGSHPIAIIAEFGLLSGEATPIDFRSDASDELGTTLRRAGIPRAVTVNKAGPQRRNTVGSIERGVRELKEAIAVLRLELRKGGVDVVNSYWLGSQFAILCRNAQSAFQDGWNRFE